MANMRMRPATAGSALAPPVDGGDIPSPRVEVVKGFEIFFVKIRSARHEQDRTPRTLGRTSLQPVQFPEFPAIGPDPRRFYRIWWNRPPIEALIFQVCHITLYRFHSVR